MCRLDRLQAEAPAGLAARFSSDIGLIGGAVRAMLGGLTGILTIAVTFVVMLSMDWALTLGICAIFAVALSVLQLFFLDRVTLRLSNPRHPAHRPFGNSR